MRLKSMTLSGFKSFPDRTQLDFGPGVSVVVGPNGSGKSNVTDAVLWAMGEQSPLAVRGQSMQDVIFGGGRGIQARSAAEVEIVLDNSDGTVELPLSEISILRRLDRNGEGGYRLNGARCRLTDVIEVLSDTGLGKETHSVISQGRVESIVTSKPRERRLLIEEAAGLGKHRKRRRRGQLKLERTQENLDRALDIEREARTRLRPLKRQAEAAELHERLERQILEARWELARDVVRGRRLELAAAQEQVVQARAARTEIEGSLQQIAEGRGEAERALSARAERHDAISKRLYESRSARERLTLRAEQVAADADRLRRRIERMAAELTELGEGQDAPADERSASEARIGALEAELAEIEAKRAQEIEGDLADLEGELLLRREQLEQMRARCESSRLAREKADRDAGLARESLATSERAMQVTRRESARVGAELAAANQFLRSHSVLEGSHAEAPKALSEELRIEEGYELALAAALGGRLDAALVADVAEAEGLLDTAGPEGGSALLAQPPMGAFTRPGVTNAGAPSAGSRRLLELLSGPTPVLELAARLLGDAWVVDSFDGVDADFQGIAVTRRGRVWFAAWGEVRQLSEGGTELVLARRNERDKLIAEIERTAQAEQAAKAAGEQAQAGVRAAEADRAGAEDFLRQAERRQAEAGEGVRRAEWIIEQRRSAPAEGPLAVRKAEIEGELSAARGRAEQRARERRVRETRVRHLRSQLESDTAIVPRSGLLENAIAAAGAVVQEHVSELEAALSAGRQAGEEMAMRLRTCAAREAEIQGALRSAGEAVTEAEVAAQRLRDLAGEAEMELGTVAGRLGFEIPTEDEQGAAALAQQALEELRARVERLTRRREQLGPVNPLAKQEYADALAHVEELESQRADLETALRELRIVIKETDQQIQEIFDETFRAAARNFEELVGDVFPGGSGRLRLVAEDHGQRPVIGGQSLPEGEDREAELEAAAEAEAEDESLSAEEQQLPGVEIEITPAGKSTKRLTLLSGGEKSMTALAFLFAVFLARPCPFYILDEVEAALDDLNLDRFLALLRRYSKRAQFIVITHQKRTMEAADWLFGVSMGGDGVSKVLSRRLPAEQPQVGEMAALA